MKIENAKWHTDLEGNNIAILCTKDGQPMVHIPINEANTDYVELKKMIDAGEVTVGDAEPIAT
tara:strand:- start:75 stop:263 length:189 start_codon:yes stop_codon:yes gene_type:complete